MKRTKWRGIIIMLMAAALMLLTAGTVMAQERGATVVEMSANVPFTVQLPAADGASSAAPDPVALTVTVDSIVAIRGGESAISVQAAAADADEEAGVVVTVSDDIESDVVVQTVAVQTAAVEDSAAEDSVTETAPASEEPEPEPEPVQPVGPTANRNANLRGGPGTNYPVAGGAKDGQTLVPVGTNADGSWYVLDDDRWIAAFLVDDAPTGLPAIEAPAAPAPAPVPAAANGGGDDADPATVIQVMSDRIAQSPNDAEAYYERGVAYFDLNDYDKALADLTKAIQLNPGLTEAYGMRGLIYLERENWTSAVQEFTQVIQRDPSSLDGYAVRGFANAMLGNVDQAIQDLERALQLGPNDSLRGGIEDLLQVLREGQ